MTNHESGLSSSTRRVLVVDDDDEIRCEIAAILRDAGYAVTEATGALAAMRSVLAAPLDVVVLNLVLPDGQGIDVARAFRAVATTRDICVVAITSHPESVELVDPRTFGAASILIKPISAKQLLDAVDGCFGDEDWTGEYEVPEKRLSS